MRINCSKAAQTASLRTISPKAALQVLRGCCTEKESLISREYLNVFIWGSSRTTSWKILRRCRLKSIDRIDFKSLYCFGKIKEGRYGSCGNRV